MGAVLFVPHIRTRIFLTYGHRVSRISQASQLPECPNRSRVAFAVIIACHPAFVSKAWKNVCRSRSLSSARFVHLSSLNLNHIIVVKLAARCTADTTKRPGGFGHMYSTTAGKFSEIWDGLRQEPATCNRFSTCYLLHLSW